MNTGSMVGSSLFHGAVAVIIQGLCYILFKDWFVGIAVSTALFYGREHAQAQYKLADGKSIKELEWSVGANPLEWNLDSKLDVAIPIAMTTSVAFLLNGVI